MKRRKATLQKAQLSHHLQVGGGNQAGKGEGSKGEKGPNVAFESLLARKKKLMGKRKNGGNLLLAKVESAEEC